jgi:hypothetical protein
VQNSCCSFKPNMCASSLTIVTPTPPPVGWPMPSPDRVRVDSRRGGAHADLL